MASTILEVFKYFPIDFFSVSVKKQNKKKQPQAQEVGQLLFSQPLNVSHADIRILGGKLFFMDLAQCMGGIFLLSFWNRVCCHTAGPVLSQSWLKTAETRGYLACL